MPLFILVYSFLALALVIPVFVSNGYIDVAIYTTLGLIAVNAFVFVVERRGKG